jgi:hypothetical protein
MLLLPFDSSFTRFIVKFKYKYKYLSYLFNFVLIVLCAFILTVVYNFVFMDYKDSFLDSSKMHNSEYQEAPSLVEEDLLPEIIDTDGDGLSDEDEINIHKTDPNNKDTDGDGYEDKSEIDNGYDPLT